jgi:ATP-dependent RNA helicase CsdA (EC 5.99.1.-)
MGIRAIAGAAPDCLVSATMPTAIRRIANNYLHDPEHVTIKVKNHYLPKLFTSATGQLVVCINWMH